MEEFVDVWVVRGALCTVDGEGGLEPVTREIWFYLGMSGNIETHSIEWTFFE